MKVIILSAGQGKRLLPLTAAIPKCLLPVQGRTIIEWQIDALHHCGIDRITVVTGYGTRQVTDLLDRRYGSNGVKVLYNASYAETDNLISCWAARDEMTEDFVLLNGDTLFETGVLRRLFESPANRMTVVVSHKDTYDADDMKVELAGCRLVRIGKGIAPGHIHGEAIGMIGFRGEGPSLFRDALEKAVNQAGASRKWYLYVIDAMSRAMPVRTVSTNGLQWCEIDYPADLEQAETVVTVISGEHLFHGDVAKS